MPPDERDAPVTTVPALQQVLRGRLQQLLRRCAP
jgi:hypothetical protein